MSFGGIFDSGGGGARVVVDIPYGGGAIPSLPKYMFSSPALSLGLMNMDGKGEVVNHNRMVGGGSTGEFDSSTGRNSKEDGCESRSGSDNIEGGSGDDLDPDLNRPSKKKKKYHRHTPQQIQELEALFKECPHPDEKQRLELSRRLSLETRQVKFWFQNRRTQMKTQLERHENSLLRQENEKLRVENMSIREAIRSPICTGCGSPAILGEASLEEQHLRLENARLKDELDRVCALATKFLGRPVSSLPCQLPSIDMGFAVGALNGSLTNAAALPPYMSDFIVPPQNTVERSIYLELALAAMDELVKMVQLDDPLWVGGASKESLNYEEYIRAFPRCLGPKPAGFASEATRETCTVMAGSLALVDTFMDATRWREMFPCIVARASTVDVISGGMGGSRNGALQLMQAELQALSPLVPIRAVNFLRFCKQHAEGVWAVVDVSVDGIRENSSHAHLACRRLPSGCILQDLPNGFSKVTWVEHAEYDEAAAHQLYRPLLRSGMAFGALRWVAALHRQCECLAILMSSAVQSRDLSVPITACGRRSMLKLAQRMTDNFCAGVCASSVHKWNKLNVGSVDEGVRVMTRKSVDDPGEPSGVVLSAATSVWLPVPPHRLFDFLRDERLRSEWDILSNGGPMQEMAHIAKGHDPGNCVSLLRASAMSANQTNMLILQETRTDASGSLVVYAPVDIPAMQVVMSGGDSAYVALLPSGFAVAPDGPLQPVVGVDGDGISPATVRSGGGSLLTVAFQILVNSLPTAKLTVESVETVNHLISCTVQKIKVALQCAEN